MLELKTTSEGEKHTRCAEQTEQGSNRAWRQSDRNHVIQRTEKKDGKPQRPGLSHLWDGI